MADYSETGIARNAIRRGTANPAVVGEEIRPDSSCVGWPSPAPKPAKRGYTGLERYTVVLVCGRQGDGEVDGRRYPGSVRLRGGGDRGE